jgi:hypothetical protein
MRGSSHAKQGALDARSEGRDERDRTYKGDAQGAPKKPVNRQQVGPQFGAI